MKVSKATVASMAMSTVLSWVSVLLLPTVLVWGPAAMFFLFAAASFRRDQRPQHPEGCVKECPRRGEDHTHGVAPKTPDGLLSQSDFASECAKLLTVKPDEVPEPPDAIPEGLRDPGFAKTRSRRQSDRADLLNGPEYKHEREMEREMRRYGFAFDRDLYQTFAPKLRGSHERKVVEDNPFVAERPFTGFTHCPNGHIGDHYLGEVVTHNDTPMIRRTCRFEKCGFEWLEAAWTTAA